MRPYWQREEGERETRATNLARARIAAETGQISCRPSHIHLRSTTTNTLTDPLSRQLSRHRHPYQSLPQQTADSGGNMSTKKDMRRPDLGRTLSSDAPPSPTKADEGLLCHLVVPYQAPEKDEGNTDFQSEAIHHLHCCAYTTMLTFLLSIRHNDQYPAHGSCKLYLRQLHVTAIWLTLCCADLHEKQVRIRLANLGWILSDQSSSDF